MSLWTATCHSQVKTQRQRDLELVDASSCVLRQSKQMPTLFESSEKGSIKCETGKWEAVVTNDSIGTCSSVLYIYIYYLLKLPAPPRAALLVST